MRMPLLPVALYGASHIWYREPAAGPDVRMVRPFEGAIKPPITTSGIFRGTVASGRARDSVHNSEPEMAGAARQPGETAVGQGIGAASAARSEERRVGKECVSTGRYRWSTHY